MDRGIDYWIETALIPVTGFAALLAALWIRRLLQGKATNVDIGKYVVNILLVPIKKAVQDTVDFIAYVILPSALTTMAIFLSRPPAEIRPEPVLITFIVLLYPFNWLMDPLKKIFSWIEKISSLVVKLGRRLFK